MKISRSLLLACVIAGTAVPAGTAPAVFTQVQQIAISAEGFNQVLHYDYGAMESTVGSVDFGNRSSTYALRLDAFVGLFLYDYSYSSFTFAFYGLAERL